MKRRSCSSSVPLVACVTCALTCLLFSAPAHAALLGDVDGDGRVTVQDAYLVARLLRHQGYPTGRDLLMADLWPAGTPPQSPGGMPASRSSPDASVPVMGDGQLTWEDVREILRCAVGLRPLQRIESTVCTFAGRVPPDPAVPDSAADGPAREVRLVEPWDLAIAPSGDIFFTEQTANRVRVLDRRGYIRTIAGDSTPGYANGPGPAARFFFPEGMALLPDGSLVVADTRNSAIRRVLADGTTTTLAGTGAPGYRDGTHAQALFHEPCGVATDPAGNVYVADTANHRIRKITPEGVVSTLAGDGKPGFIDGPALQGRLYSPSGVVYDPHDGGLFIADMANDAIRKLSAGGDLTTLAGAGRHCPGHADGFGPRARFRSPYGLDLDAAGRLWIADWGNEAIRMLDPDGRVTTVSGGLSKGYRDGPTSIAHYRGLMNVRIGPGGVFLADTDNGLIRLLVP